jgi:hypothetical protein
LTCPVANAPNPSGISIVVLNLGEPLLEVSVGASVVTTERRQPPAPTDIRMTKIKQKPLTSILRLLKEIDNYQESEVINHDKNHIQNYPSQVNAKMERFRDAIEYQS